MNARRDAGRKPWPSALVVAVGLLLMAVLAACGAVPASTPSPGANNDGTSNEAGNTGPGDDGSTDLSRTEVRGEGDVAVGAPTLSDYQTYSWVGVVVEGEIEGPHFVVERDCDKWVLLPANEEVEAKLRENIGKKLTIWGEISYEPSIFMQQSIKVSSAHAEGDVVIDLYVPEYPCPGDVDPAAPINPHTRPAPGFYGGFDVQDGEIAAIGKLVQDGDRWYLETAGGRILLTGNVKPAEIGGGEIPPDAPRDLPMPMPEDCVMSDPDAPVSSEDDAGQGSSGVSYSGCAPTPGSTDSGGTASGGSAPGYPGVDDDWDSIGYAEPAYACRPATDDTLVVGRWSVQDGSLAIDVRYTSYWGEYVCDYPTPLPTDPMPEPDTSMGVIYGHIEVGPLCPVELCSDEDRAGLFDGKVLVLEGAEGMDPVRLEVTPDGWFKGELPVGVYVMSMPDCPWMGCESAFPTDIRVVHDAHEEWVIRIDTGIR